MAEVEKLVLMVTHGPDEPELASIPFALAGAALASDVEVVMGFQADGCLLMKKGVAEGVSAPGFTPLGELLPVLQELGASFLVCAPCLKSHGIDESEFVDGTEVVASARFVAEITSATNCLVY
ncbi:MAG TPA: DsrE family protein [Acidimicrobiales bacterium]|nr:DsrE family protein [Acidimicrobiales bacterium]